MSVTETVNMNGLNLCKISKFMYRVYVHIYRDKECSFSYHRNYCRFLNSQNFSKYYLQNHIIMSDTLVGYYFSRLSKNESGLIKSPACVCVCMCVCVCVCVCVCICLSVCPPLIIFEPISGFS
jgi:hypothetical protein